MVATGPAGRLPGPDRRPGRRPARPGRRRRRARSCRRAADSPAKRRRPAGHALHQPAPQRSAGRDGRAHAQHPDRSVQQPHGPQGAELRNRQKHGDRAQRRVTEPRWQPARSSRPRCPVTSRTARTRPGLARAGRGARQIWRRPSGSCRRRGRRATRWWCCTATKARRSPRWRPLGTWCRSSMCSGTGRRCGRSTRTRTGTYSATPATAYRSGSSAGSRTTRRPRTSSTRCSPAVSSFPTIRATPTRRSSAIRRSTPRPGKPWASQVGDPATAAGQWAAVDHEIVDQAPWVPLYNPRDLTVLSARTGNYQFHPYWNLLLDQLWIR